MFESWHKGVIKAGVSAKPSSQRIQVTRSRTEENQGSPRKLVSLMQPVSPASPGWTLAVLAIAAALMAVDLTIVSVALP